MQRSFHDIVVFTRFHICQVRVRPEWFLLCRRILRLKQANNLCLVPLETAYANESRQLKGHDFDRFHDGSTSKYSAQSTPDNCLPTTLGLAENMQVLTSNKFLHIFQRVVKALVLICSHACAARKIDSKPRGNSHK